MEKHIVASENAAKLDDWLRTRGGIAIWSSIDLSDPGKTVTTPVNTADGTPTGKPGWQFESFPSRIITDPDEVVVSTDEEVKRFHVAVRMGSQGFKIKLTDASSDRVRKAVEKAGKGSFYQFDYYTQEAVIYKPVKMVPLTKFMAKTAGA